MMTESRTAPVDQQPRTMAGRTALISGSSRGIGAGIAQELSSRGANIVLNYPYASEQATCESVGATLATPWIAVCADLTTDHGATDLVAAAVARFGHIDIVVSNAGIVPLAPLWDADLATWDAAMGLNARGAFSLARASLPHLTPYTPTGQISGAAGGSRIVIVGSAASRAPKKSQGVYAATKGALDAMLRVWAAELPPRYGCTVNLVAPGPVYTETFRSHFKTEGDFEAVKAMIEAETPVEGGMASVEDVAWAVAFLAEERSRFINGEYMFVSGGSTMG